MAKPTILEVTMWYALQVKSGQEEELCQIIQEKKLMDIEDCFVLKRERIKKFGGAFHKIEELLFPNYIFLVVKKEKEIEAAKYLKEILSLLESDEKDSPLYLLPLNEQEIDFIKRWGDSTHLSKISIVCVEEKTVKVIKGDLKTYEREITKIDLHRRTAIIQTNFLGKRRNIYMGFQIWGKDFQ